MKCLKKQAINTGKIQGKFKIDQNKLTKEEKEIIASVFGLNKSPTYHKNFSKSIKYNDDLNFLYR